MNILVKLLNCLQIAGLVGGLGIAGVGIITFAQESTAILVPKIPMYTLVVCGSGLMAACLFGLIAGLVERLRGKKRYWLLYTFIVVVLAGIATSGLAIDLIQVGDLKKEGANEKTSTIIADFSQYWDHADPFYIDSIQKGGQCCGFADYDDRVLEPCQRYSEQVGCIEVLRDQYLYYEWIFRSVTIGAISICAIGILVGTMMTLLIKGSRKKSNDSMNLYKGNLTKSYSKYEPFEDWHKAVFS